MGTIEDNASGSWNRANGASMISSNEAPPAGLGRSARGGTEEESRLLEDQREKLDYWVKQLNSSRPAEFFYDKPRPTVPSGQVDVRSLGIKGALYDHLQQYCKDRGTSSLVVLLAAFRAVQYRLTGVDDATIGVLKRSYGTADAGDMTSYLGKLECIRLTVDNETFEDLVRQAQTTIAAAQANQGVSAEKLVARLQQDRDLSLQPLVRATFSLHFRDADPADLFVGHGTDFSFGIFDTNSTLECRILFSTDLYDGATASSVLAMFRKVLQEALAEPATPISSLPLLGADEFDLLVKGDFLRVGGTKYPRELSVVDVFRQQVAASPDRIAIKDGSGSLTYTQLDERSDHLAVWLAGQSLSPETLVGVLSPRCSLTVIAFLGILKASLAYLPLDPKTPPYRMKTIISAMKGRKLILLGPGMETPAGIHGIEPVRISQVIDDATPHNGVSHESVDRPLPSATSLAYVMFTSGSTGEPKGVMIEHRGIVRLAKQSNLLDNVPPAAIMAHISNVAFDAATWEIYATLLNGGQLICVDEMTVLDYAAMNETFIRENIQTAFFTTALFKEYTRTSPEIITHLTAVFVGGERLDPGDLLAALRVMKG